MSSANMHGSIIAVTIAVTLMGIFWNSFELDVWKFEITYRLHFKEYNYRIHLLYSDAY